MGRRRFRLQTDGHIRTNGQTNGLPDARAIAMSPEPIGRGIKMT